MLIQDYVSDQLKKMNLSLADFQQVVVRLMDYGVICRDGSNKEQELYDLYARMELLINSYLSVTGIQIQHDKRFHYVRLYPPGAVVPGMADPEDSPYQSFRTRISQQEVALILVLRAQYEQLLREGQIDEKGCVAISIESINIAMHTLLNRSLPGSLTERKGLFKKLKQLRLIQFSNEDVLENVENWVKITPQITGFVQQSVLDQLVSDQPASVTKAQESAESTGENQEPVENLSAQTEQSSEASYEQAAEPSALRAVVGQDKIILTDQEADLLSKSSMDMDDWSLQEQFQQNPQQLDAEFAELDQALGLVSQETESDQGQQAEQGQAEATLLKENKHEDGIESDEELLEESPLATVLREADQEHSEGNEHSEIKQLENIQSQTASDAKENQQPKDAKRLTPGLFDDVDASESLFSMQEEP